MNRKVMVLTVVLADLCASCAWNAQVPIPATEPPSQQAKLKAVNHWDLIAADVSQEVIRATRGGGIRPVYIANAKDSTDFNRAFRNLLLAQLVSRGMPVASRPDGATILTFETQLVRHSSRRSLSSPFAITELAAGLAVLRNVALHGNDTFQTIGGLGAIAAAEAVSDSYPGPIPQTELIVTTTVTDGNRIVSGKSDVYYVEEVDTALFLPVPPPPQVFLKQVRVVGDKQ